LPASASGGVATPGVVCSVYHSFVGDLLCAGCGAGLPPEAAHRPVKCAYCSATSVPPPRVIERVVERVVVAAARDGETRNETERAAVFGAAAAPATARLHCPRCAAGLLERQVGPGLVAACKACGGLWLATAIVDRLRAAHDHALEEALRRPFGVVITVGPTPNRHAGIGCPECAAPLRRVDVPNTIHSIDVCDAHGTWFDARELPIVLDAFEAARAGVVTDDDMEAAGVGGGLLSRIFGRRGPRG
jgi:Zn-finger nucleic acid-binding protein